MRGMYTAPLKRGSDLFVDPSFFTESFRGTRRQEKTENIPTSSCWRVLTTKDTGKTHSVRGGYRTEASRRRKHGVNRVDVSPGLILDCISLPKSLTNNFPILTVRAASREEPCRY